MRNVKTIESEIARLQAELADVKDHDAMRDSAVHILKNLGWTRRAGKWQQPIAARRPSMRTSYAEFDRDTMSPFKEGDFVKSVTTGRAYRVQQVNGKFIVIDEIVMADFHRGVRTKGKLLQSRGENFKPITTNELVAMFVG